MIDTVQAKKVIRAAYDEVQRLIESSTISRDHLEDARQEVMLIWLVVGLRFENLFDAHPEEAVARITKMVRERALELAKKGRRARKLMGSDAHVDGLIDIEDPIDPHESDFDSQLERAEAFLLELSLTEVERTVFIQHAIEELTIRSIAKVMFGSGCRHDMDKVRAIIAGVKRRLMGRFPNGFHESDEAS